MRNERTLHILPPTHQEGLSTMTGHDLAQEISDRNISDSSVRNTVSPFKTFKPYFNYPRSKSDVEKMLSSGSTTDDKEEATLINTNNCLQTKASFGPHPQPRSPSNFFHEMKCLTELDTVHSAEYDFETFLSDKSIGEPTRPVETFDHEFITLSPKKPSGHHQGKSLKSCLTQRPNMQALPSLRTQRTLGQSQALNVKQAVPLPKAQLTKTKTCGPKAIHNWVNILW